MALKWCAACLSLLILAVLQILSELALLPFWACFERGVSGLYERLLYNGLLFARYPGRCVSHGDGRQREAIISVGLGSYYCATKINIICFTVPSLNRGS